MPSELTAAIAASFPRRGSPFDHGKASSNARARPDVTAKKRQQSDTDTLTTYGPLTIKALPLQPPCNGADERGGETSPKHAADSTAEAHPEDGAAEEEHDNVSEQKEAAAASSEAGNPVIKPRTRVRRSTRAPSRKRRSFIESSRASVVTMAYRYMPVTQRWMWADTSESDDSDVPLSMRRAKRTSKVERSASTDVREPEGKNDRQTLIIILKVTPTRLKRQYSKQLINPTRSTKKVIAGPTATREALYTCDTRQSLSPVKRKLDFNSEERTNKRMRYTKSPIIDSLDNLDHLDEDEAESTGNPESSYETGLPGRSNDGADDVEALEEAAQDYDIGPAVADAPLAPSPVEKIDAGTQTEGNLHDLPSRQRSMAASHVDLARDQVILAKLTSFASEPDSAHIRLDDRSDCSMFWTRVNDFEHLLESHDITEGQIRIAMFDTRHLGNGIQKDIFNVGSTIESYEAAYDALYWDLRRLQAMHPNERIHVPVNIEWVKIQK